MNLENMKNTILGIDSIQAYALDIYGKYDLEKSMIWMVEELGEVIAAIRKGKTKEEICGEIGDLTAWVLCICNILDIKMSEAVKQTFEKEINRQLRVYGKLKYIRHDDSKGQAI